MYIAVASTKTNLTLQFCLASNMSAATWAEIKQKIQKQLCSVIYIAGTSAKNNATLHHIAIQSIHEVTVHIRSDHYYCLCNSKYSFSASIASVGVGHSS